MVLNAYDIVHLWYIQPVLEFLLTFQMLSNNVPSIQWHNKSHQQKIFPTLTIYMFDAAALQKYVFSMRANVLFSVGCIRMIACIGKRIDFTKKCSHNWKYTSYSHFGHGVFGGRTSVATKSLLIIFNNQIGKLVM